MEARTYEEAIEGANAGADIVMLDNMNANQIKMESKKIKNKFPKLILEASGG